MDGLCDSRHNPSSGLSEYSQAIQPIQVIGANGLEITIVNRHDFLTLDDVKCYWDIIADRKQIIGHEVHVPKGIQPHAQATLVLGGALAAKIQNLSTTASTTAGAWLELAFRQQTASSWAPAGRTIARAQVPLTPPESLATILKKERALLSSSETTARTGKEGEKSYPHVEVRDDGALYCVTIANGTTFGFDTRNGTLSYLTHASSPSSSSSSSLSTVDVEAEADVKDMIAPGENLITQPLTLDLYRAQTDNDRGGPFGPEWVDRRVHQTRQHFERMTTATSTSTPTPTDSSSTVNRENDQTTTTTSTTVKITIQSRVAPPVLAWSIATTTTYTFTASSCHIRVQARPSGALLPTTFARFGLSLGLRSVRIVEWFGRGPQESYRDKKRAQYVNTWGFAVDGMWADYDVPQDNGNRTDVRWVELRSSWGGEEKGRLLRARFGDHNGGSFSVSRYGTKDVDECMHPYELHKRKREDCLVRLDWYHHGLGTGSCGPATLPEYQLKADQEFDVELLLD